MTLFLSRRSKNTLSNTRYSFLVAIRILVIFFLVSALCGPSIDFPVRGERLVVFLLDVSESISDQAKKEAIEFIREFRADKKALVVFAGEYGLIRKPDRSLTPLATEELEKILYKTALLNIEDARKIEPILKWKKALDTKRTDPAKGIFFSRMLFEKNFDNSILLMTDGNFESKLDKDVFLYPLDVSSPEIIARKIQLPSFTNYGKPIDASIFLSSNTDAAANIKISIDNVLIPEYTRDVRVRKGENHFVVKNLGRKDLLSKGTHTISAIISSDKDTEKRNNYSASAIQIIGRQNTIVFKDHTEDISSLQKMISAQDIEVHTADFKDLPNMRNRFSSYDSVIFVGLPENEILQQIYESLGLYVSDQGGGFLLCASKTMLKTKIQESTLQKILPVNFSHDQFKPEVNSAPTQVRAPQITMLFLIDKSGSMAGKNLTIAKESCIESAKVLSDNDYVGVIAFDAKAHLVVKPTKANEVKEIEDKVLKLFADGGTSIYEGLVLAKKTLQDVKTSIKHIVLLSDGITSPAKFDEVIKDLVADGVTISTVCAGSEEFDIVVMDQIAKAGKGRMMFSSSFNKIPQIFINETKHIISTSKKDTGTSNGKNDTPTGISARLLEKDSHEILKGIDTKNLPQIGGYIKSKEKKLAQSVIETEDRNPLVAIWHHGLGKTAFFSSEIGTSWSYDFFRWDDGKKIFAHLLRYLSNSVSTENLYSRTYISTEFDLVKLKMETKESEKIEITLLEPKGEINSYTHKNDIYAELKMTRPEALYKIQIRAGLQTIDFASILSYEPEFARIGKNIDYYAQNKDKIGLPENMESKVNIQLKTTLAIICLFLLTISVFLRRYNL